MALEVGALSLKLTEDNLKSVLKDINAIDQASARVAKTLSGPVESSFQKVGQRATQTGRSIQLVGEATARQYASSAQKVAAVGVAMANTGEAGVKSFSKLITVGANVAFMFGLGGPIVGAIGLTGLAIFSLFKNAREEMEKTRVDFEKNLNQMVNAADNAGLSGSARNIWLSGKADGTGNPAEGLGALKAKQAQEQANFDEAVRTRNVFLFNSAKRALKELKEKIDPLQAEYDKLIGAVVSPFPSQSRPQVPISIEAPSPAKTRRDAEKAAELARQRRESQERSDYARNQARVARGRAGAGMGSQGILRFPIEPKVEIKGKSGSQDVVERFGEYYREIAQGMLEHQQKLADTIRNGIGQTLGDAIYNGFSEAFSGGGLGGMFKAFGKTILAGIGSILTDMGTVWISYGIMMSTLGAALWNPFTSGPAAIAIGAGLIALGGAIGGIAHGGGGRSRGGSSVSDGGNQRSSDDVTHVILQPTAAGAAGKITPMQPMQITIIGPDDPRAQTQILDLVNNALGRVA